MDMYRVDFEFMITDPEETDGKWHKDFVDNNGKGFNYGEALHVAYELMQSSIARVRSAKPVKMA